MPLRFSSWHRHRLVGGFEQAGAKAFVNTHRQADDLVCEIVTMGEAWMHSEGLGNPVLSLPYNYVLR
jgi:hypothetical protein